jgi:excisionase family DNA binding protein
MSAERASEQLITVRAAESEDVQRLRELLRQVSARPTQERATLTMGEGTPVEVPPVLLDALAHLAGWLAQGEDVELLPVPRDVSIAEAALLLSVSPPAVLHLVESGELPARGTGKTLRIPLQVVIRYKAHRQVQDRADLATALQVAQEAGAYE